MRSRPGPRASPRSSSSSSSAASASSRSSAGPATSNRCRERARRPVGRGDRDGARAVRAATTLGAAGAVASSAAGSRPARSSRLVAFATALLHGPPRRDLRLLGRRASLRPHGGLRRARSAALWGAVVGEACRGAAPAALVRACCSRWRGRSAGSSSASSRFYGSPMVFAYDPFFGYFSGTLYDTVVDVRTELWTYRAGSLATLAGAVLVALARSTREGGRSRLRRSARRPRRREGGRVLRGGVRGAGGEPRGHARRARARALADGGDDRRGPRRPRARARAATSSTPTRSRPTRRRSSCATARRSSRPTRRASGRTSTGASRRSCSRTPTRSGASWARPTRQIAKPWRREVYVQIAGYPHPVLGHEIAHVVAGSFARAALPRRRRRSRAEPGAHRGRRRSRRRPTTTSSPTRSGRARCWTSASCRDAELFSLGFLGESAAKSYTVAGAFVGWVLDRWGAGRRARVVRRRLDRGADGRELGRARRALPRLARHAADARRRRRPTRTPSSSGRASGRGAARTSSTRSTATPTAAATSTASTAPTRSTPRALARDPRDCHAHLRPREDGRPERGPTQARRGRDALARLVADEAAPRTWRDRARRPLADDDLVRGRRRARGRRRTARSRRGRSTRTRRARSR